MPRASSGPDEVVHQGFTPLFNGTNLDDWMVQQPANRDWQVVDGVIDCNPHEGQGDKNLWTTKSFGDFELLVDWRIKESSYINRAAKIILPNGTYKKDNAGKDVLLEVPNPGSGIFLRGRRTKNHERMPDSGGPDVWKASRPHIPCIGSLGV